MAYKRSIYLKAKEKLDARRAAAEQLRQQRHAEVLQKCPELEEIEREIASAGAELVKCAAKGEDAAAYVMELSLKNQLSQQKRADLLREHGFPADYLETVYTCPICKDTGTHEAYYCQCYLDLIRQTAKESLPAAAQLKACTFETFDLRYYSDEIDPALGVSHRQVMQSVVTFLKEYCSSFSSASQGLLMVGKTGLGKTHLSLAAVNRLIDRGFNVYYTTAQAMLDRLQKQQFSRGYVDEDLDADLFESDLLIIDDLGTEMTTSFTVSALYHVLNTRLGNGRPTAFSTNLELNDLEQIYSQRFTSRLVGSCRIIKFFGKDVRQQKARLQYGG